MRRLAREDRRTPHAKRGQVPPRVPSIFNEEGNPYMRGYVCCGRPFFGFWMGPITLVIIALTVAWMFRSFWLAGINLERRGQRAESACGGVMRYWDRLLITNWTTAPDEQNLERVSTFFGVFANGPFSFAEPFDADNGKILSHGPKRGYALEYDTMDRQSDAHALYAILRELAPRAGVLVTQRRRPHVETYYTQAQVDNRGEYVLTGADLVYRYSLPAVGIPTNRYEWSFRLTCKMRATGPDPEKDRNAWTCYEAMLSHRHVETAV